MQHYNKAYHKGKYSFWVKHLRPDGKRLCNKLWRRDQLIFDETVPKRHSFKKSPKTVKLKITKYEYGRKNSDYRTYRNMRDAKNAMRQAHVIRVLILES